MILFEKTKRNGGLTIWGSHYDLKELHVFIVTMAEKSIVLPSDDFSLDNSILFNFSYEVRHAYLGQRKTSIFESGDDEVAIYGFDIDWVQLICCLAILRTNIAYNPSSKADQAMMYTIEALMENALLETLPDQKDRVLYFWDSLVGNHESRYFGLIGAGVACFLSLTPAKRARLLPEIIKLVNPQRAIFEEFRHKKDSEVCLSRFSWDTLGELSHRQLAL